MTKDMEAARKALDQAHEAISFGNINKGVNIIAAALAKVREEERERDREAKHFAIDAIEHAIDMDYLDDDSIGRLLTAIRALAKEEQKP